MYSVVLMVAVTAGADSADFGRRNRCGGGCHGAVACHGGGYGGCHGGYGGGWGCHGGRGWGCYGGGGGWGCHGGGGWGCYGGGGGWGCYGGHVGGYHGGHAIGGCHGGYGMGGCHGGHVGGYHGGHVGYGVPYASSTVRSGTAVASSRDRATLIVELPADARLTIDGRPTTSTSAQRRFVTPPLDRNGNYNYTLEATVIRDGAPVTMTKDVAVRPGQETRVSLDLPTGVAASGQ